MRFSLICLLNLVAGSASFDDAIAKGGMSGTAADYKKLTGVEPVGFEGWLNTNAAALAG